MDASVLSSTVSSDYSEMCQAFVSIHQNIRQKSWHPHQGIGSELVSQHHSLAINTVFVVILRDFRRTFGPQSLVIRRQSTAETPNDYG